MSHVLIYLSEKSAMQSGKAKSKRWILEKRNPDAKDIEGVMGWQSTDDTTYQTKLFFNSCEDALEYSDQNGLSATVLSTHKCVAKPKSYGDNFTKGLRF